MPVLDIFRTHFDYALLLFLRVSGLLVGSPIFGRKNVPNMSKIGFCVVLTLIFMYGHPRAADLSVSEVCRNTSAVLRELLFGAAMGFVLTCMLTSP
jgi:flagellar biosynthetic protein FliR